MNAVDTAISTGLGSVPSEIATHSPEIITAALAVSVLAFGVKYVRKLLGR